MEFNKNISLAVVKRLPRYYRYLGDMLDDGIERISSKEMSERMGVTASQIRQDLNNFGCFGQQGYGYNTKLLYSEIKAILGLEKQHAMILVGAGNIGQALVNYARFPQRGFSFVAIFDIDPRLVGLEICGIEIYNASRLSGYLANNHVDIAVLAVPKEQVLKMSKVVLDGGAKGIWNFSSIDLKVPNDVKVENVRLMESLMTLSYKLNEEEILKRVEYRREY